MHYMNTQDVYVLRMHGVLGVGFGMLICNLYWHECSLLFFAYLCYYTVMCPKVNLEGVTWIGDMDVNMNEPQASSFIMSNPEKYNLVCSVTCIKLLSLQICTSNHVHVYQC